ncbi:cyclopropane-fatty-acyl-phospholipid synthase family protein [Marinobacteraceae bacterium S3BR75-40.1]
MENITTTAMGTQSRRSIDGLARHLVLRQLSHLQQGVLEVQDERGHEVLGDGNEAFPKAELTVRDNSMWRDFLTGGSIGAAEAYVAGDWDSPDLVAFLRLFVRNIDQLNAFEDRFAWISKPVLKWLHWLNRNSVAGSRKNIEAHYDLGNDLFEQFLDPSMMYSSALFPSPGATLAEAQHHKLDRICQKLDLQPGDRLIEIGTGWGGLAIHAARHYGCHVTTTTISQAQYDWAAWRISEEGLEDRITLLADDYRDLQGQFDKLVSVEMIEAVGPDYLDGYMQQISRLLRPGGTALLQAINMPEQRYRRALKNVDFIQRYIFPGSFIPSFGAILESVRKTTDLTLLNLEDFGLDYARTLELWRERFTANADRIRTLGYDDRFLRLWTFYFAYCEAGFAERAIGVAHLVFQKPGHAVTGNTQTL